MPSAKAIETTVELLVLAALSLQGARIAAAPAVRRELREGPKALLALALAVLILLLAASIPLLAASPQLLRILVGAALATSVLCTFRARVTYGARKRLPPGSLSLRSSLAALVDRDFYSEQIERHGPVFKMAQFHRPVVCVLGIGRGRSLLKRYEHSLSPPPLPLSREIPCGFLRYMKPSDHQIYAPLFRAAFSSSVLEANQPLLADRATHWLDDLAQSSRHEAQGLHPSAATDPYLVETLAKIFFGNLVRAEDLPTLKEWIAQAEHSNAVGSASQKARQALEQFTAFLRARHLETTGDDHHGPRAGACSTFSRAPSTPSIWSGLLERNNGAEDDDTVLGNLFVLLLASHDSIGSTLVWIVKFLGENPEWLDRLRSEQTETRQPSAGAAQHSARLDLASRIVIETLRLAQSEYVYRRVEDEIAVDGFTIPKGWLVRILVAESHLRDPPFEHPRMFDPDRHLGRSFSSNELSPFGLDHHACLGARLTLLLCRAFTQQLSEYQLTVQADGPVERGNRHWMHWAPSSRLRVALR